MPPRAYTDSDEKYLHAQRTLAACCGGANSARLCLMVTPWVSKQTNVITLSKGQMRNTLPEALALITQYSGAFKAYRLVDHTSSFAAQSAPFAWQDDESRW